MAPVHSTTSAIYAGRVRHRRHAPVEHAFSYDVAMLYLDLDRLEEDFARPPLSSVGKFTPLCFREADYLPGRDGSLSDSVRDRVEAKIGRRPAGPVRLLTHVRTFGHVFNPVSFYYCFDLDGETVEAILVEITNTPWKQRHCYVLQPPSDTDRGVWYEFDKAFHVSPFLPMTQMYRWFLTPPREQLCVHMENFDTEAETEAGQPLRRFDATLQLERRAISRTALAQVLLRYPMMTLQVVAAIHWQALRLWSKRVPFFSHPAKRSTASIAPARSRSTR